MKAAIIGARGFIGQRLVELLSREEGLDIVPVARSGAGLPPGTRIADALDSDALAQALAGCDAVVHAISGPPNIITGAIAPLLSAAQAAGVKRIVYLSSGSVHGQSPAAGSDEDSPLSTNQPMAYNNAKVLAERALRQASAPEITILRPGIVHGPGSRWLTEFPRAMADGTACLVDRGENICNACHVDNLAHAVHLALTVPEAAGETFIVGDTETVRWRDLYAPVAAAMGRSLDDLPPAPQPDDAQPREGRLKRALRRALRRPHPSITHEMAMLQSCRVKLPDAKARRILGYAPPVSLAHANAQAEDWLRRAKPWRRDDEQW